ncbi:hypothetical protein HF675_19075 [Serratia sp. JUb9]|uniref:COG4648 family protein n=1 Tax=Serratia sp. JUb9 TaxID=2724469 RepID=UPI00164ECEBC|nr:hypothetical protein [Serratia sp. JUb9]QNK31676.1 hypothetical protein HF675_19075 [Serratia sp. JUb9]
MRRWLAHSRTLLQALTWLLLALYPFAVWFGVSRWGTQLLAPLLALLFTLRLLSLRGGWRQHGGLAKMLALVGIVLAVSSWLLGQSRWLLYYPVLVSLLLLALFAYSLWFPPTVVERLARLREPALSAAGVAYTRRVTQVWCGFFIVNASIALITCQLGDIKLWTLYNGGISYLLMGALMGGEWIARQRVKRR